MIMIIMFFLRSISPHFSLVDLQSKQERTYLSILSLLFAALNDTVNARQDIGICVDPSILSRLHPLK